MKIGFKIQSLRENLGMTQRDLANKIDISYSVMNRIESGTRAVRDDEVIKIADALDVSTDYLLGVHVNEKTPSNNRHNKIIEVPVLGSIPAGIPIAAIEDICDYEEITIPQSANSLDYFALKVFGDSMAPRIQSGDVVVCRKQDSVDNGDIAVVLIDGEDATLKRIQKNADGISLIPDNTAYRPKFFTSNEIVTIPIKILGKVIELRGKF